MVDASRVSQPRKAEAVDEQSITEAAAKAQGHHSMPSPEIASHRASQEPE